MQAPQPPEQPDVRSSCIQSMGLNADLEQILTAFIMVTSTI